MESDAFYGLDAGKPFYLLLSALPLSIDTTDLVRRLCHHHGCLITDVSQNMGALPLVSFSGYIPHGARYRVATVRSPNGLRFP